MRKLYWKDLLNGLRRKQLSLPVQIHGSPGTICWTVIINVLILKTRPSDHSLPRFHFLLEACWIKASTPWQWCCSWQEPPAYQPEDLQRRIKLFCTLGMSSSGKQLYYERGRELPNVTSILKNLIYLSVLMNASSDSWCRQRDLLQVGKGR